MSYEKHYFEISPLFIIVLKNFPRQSFTSWRDVYSGKKTIFQNHFFIRFQIYDLAFLDFEITLINRNINVLCSNSETLSQEVFRYNNKYGRYFGVLFLVTHPVYVI